MGQLAQAALAPVDKGRGDAMTAIPCESDDRVGSVVTIAIPTYQRATQLRRAIDSVLAQDYGRIEVVISDNASTDGTEELCEHYVNRHRQVRYIKQAVNVGPTPNFEKLRSVASGGYFLFLGDDDWIDPDYVSSCVAAIEANPGSSLVAGMTLYHRADGSTAPEPHPVTIDAADGASRVRQFCRQVRANGVFYGVVPASANERVPPLRNVQGGDMLHVMALAYLGSVRTLDGVAVHRTVDGMTVSLANVATTLGLGWFQANVPQIAIAYWIFRDIAFDSPLYAELGRWGRLRLGVRSGGTVFVRFVPPAVLKFIRLQTKAVARRMRLRPTPGRAR
jgi:glycosyltransferase involved in cell wall biosynthesis